jgi:beta-fructofuranosidase
MFYTGISTREDAAVQRVGLATSRDLMRWERQDLVLEADPRWYRKLGAGVRDEAWRDPWVFRDERSGRFHMLLTATAAHGPLETGGVVGHAWSDDLREWRTEPPTPGRTTCASGGPGRRSTARARSPCSRSRSW